MAYLAHIASVQSVCAAAHLTLSPKKFIEMQSSSVYTYICTYVALCICIWYIYEIWKNIMCTLTLFSYPYYMHTYTHMYNTFFPSKFSTIYTVSSALRASIVFAFQFPLLRVHGFLLRFIDFYARMYIHICAYKNICAGSI